MVAETAAAMVGRRTAPEKFRCSSSRANIIPATGALKAAARPAPAPAVMRYRSSMRVRPMKRLRPCAATAPIWIDGPSRPSERPAPIPAAPATIFTQSIRSQSILKRPRMTPLTCGIPEPEAMGATRHIL